MTVGAVGVRPVDSAADFGALVDCRRRWAEEHGGPDEHGFAQRMADWADRVGVARHSWLAWSTSTALGMVTLVVYERMPHPGAPPARWAYVGQLWVDPAYRRRGVGRALMAAAIDWATESGMQRLVLNPSELSRPLYAALGFRSAVDLLRLDLPGSDRVPEVGQGLP